MRYGSDEPRIGRYSADQSLHVAGIRSVRENVAGIRPVRENVVVVRIDAVVGIRIDDTEGVDVVDHATRNLGGYVALAVEEVDDVADLGLGRYGRRIGPSTSPSDDVVVYEHPEHVFARVEAEAERLHQPRADVFVASVKAYEKREDDGQELVDRLATDDRLLGIAADEDDPVRKEALLDVALVAVDALASAGDEGRDRVRGIPVGVVPAAVREVLEGSYRNKKLCRRRSRRRRGAVAGRRRGAAAVNAVVVAAVVRCHSSSIRSASCLVPVSRCACRCRSFDEGVL